MSLDPETQSYLGGLIKVMRLPEFGGPAGPDAPILKRLHLAQGELAQIWDGREGVRYIAAVELLPGAIRGNHYHEKKLEFVYVVVGAARLVAQDTTTSDRCEVELRPGLLARIETRVAHALVPQSAGFALEFSPVPFEIKDTCPFKLV